MPRYIEFTTATPDKIGGFTAGNPYHDGVIPAGRLNVDGVRVDGEIVEFVDPSIPNRLHRTLYEIDRLTQRQIVVDCLAFVAMMAGENLSVLPNSSGTKFPDVERNWYDPESGPSEDPLYLLRREGGDMNYVHAIYPAHLLEAENYLHKLNIGPVIMSDFRSASAMYKSRSADKMPTVKYGTKTY